MKIAYIGQKGIPVTFGGVEYHVDRLSEELVKSGHVVTVYVRNWYTQKDLKSYKGVRLVHIFTIRSKHLDAAVHSFLCTIHSLFSKYDVIHYHGIGPSFFSLIPKLVKKRIVCTIHRLDWDTEKWGKIAKKLLKLGELISVKIPQKTIVVSEDLKNYVKKKYRKNPIHIPHGIDLPQLKPPNLIREKYNLKGNDYILYMGRLVPEKRVDWLIKAFHLALQKSSQIRDIKLVVAGGSSATQDYTDKVKIMSQNDRNIILTGYVTGVEKEELLSNALIFSLPSRLEGFPIVLLEAKSYGICCLASNIPPHREAIHPGMDGLLFRSDDFKSLTRNLLDLIEDPGKCKVMGKNARNAIKKLPSWEIVAKRTAHIYNELL